MLSVGFMGINLRRRSSYHFHHARHPYISVADCSTPSAADTGHREFPLNKIVRQLSEEAAVTAIMHGLAWIVASGHTCETSKSAGVPHSDTFDFIGSYLAIGHRKTSAGRAHI